MIKITIDTDNAAFTPCAGTEVARILRELAERIEYADLTDSFDSTGLRDSNGNKVGDFAVRNGKEQ